MKCFPNRFSAVAVVCLAVATGCGGAPSKDFEGLWLGTTSITGFGSTISYSSSLLIGVEEDALRVSQFCPDGGGTLLVDASGRSGSWEGTAICHVPTQGCATTAIRYTSAEFTVSDGGRVLTVSGDGVVDSCGAGGPISVIFTGSR